MKGKSQKKAAAKDSNGGEAKQPQPPFPKQKQASPGLEAELKPKPRYEAGEYKAAGKLEGKVA